ncbi:MAG: PIG-L family deacetylase [Pseudonocardiales bacterium]|nr:PIG-L family deacetylase [Pseudonocardiales bacterium]
MERNDYWVVSPHADDAVLSAGALIHFLAEAGRSVGVFTIFAGHGRGERSPLALSAERLWGLGSDAVASRQREDQRACSRLGATVRFGESPDAVYRRDPTDGTPLYAHQHELFGEMHPHDRKATVQNVADELTELRANHAFLVPSAHGDHVDHRIAKHAAQLVLPDRQVWSYADLPYAESAGRRTFRGSTPSRGPVSDTDSYTVKLSAAAEYSSQLALVTGASTSRQALAIVSSWSERFTRGFAR